jgi:pantoate--beta-alanine ligase
VATVVLKLFNLVSPHAAIFGKKDYQQYLVLRDMVRQFALPIEITPAETVRAPDGLALSSRNGYLSPDERREAPRLYRVLQEVESELKSGMHDYQRLELHGMSMLADKGWKPDYVTVRRRSDLQPPLNGEKDLVVLAAARLGRIANPRRFVLPPAPVFRTGAAAGSAATSHREIFPAAATSRPSRQ